MIFRTCYRILVILLAVITCEAQVTPDPLKTRLDHVFDGLNQTEISSGILLDYGLDLADATLYDGVIRSENTLTMDRWRALYGSLLTSVTNPSTTLVHLKTINQTLEDLWASYDLSNPIVDLPVQFVAYQALRPDALTSNLLSVSNDRLSDVPGRAQSPYTTGYAFAMAPHIGYSHSGRVSFILRSSLFVNSSSKTLSGLAMDFDNGEGYVHVTMDTPVDIAYDSAGSKTLKCRITFTDGTIYYSHAKFDVYTAVPHSPATRYVQDESRQFNFPRANATNCAEPGFPNPEAWQGTAGGARVTVHYGDLAGRIPLTSTCTPQLIRPLIVVEGFDISNYSAFGEANWDFKKFVETSVNGGLDVGVANGRSLNDTLDIAGYDLVFVDFTDGTGDIVRNAYVVENVIQWVNTHKIANTLTGQRERNVVLGQSMGGLVARYAVCDLEKRRIANATFRDHEVRRLITQDTPHRGANVPLGFQVLVNNLATQSLTRLGFFTYGSTGAIVGSFLDMQDLVPTLKQGRQLLNAPATRQMLLVQDGQTNTFLNSTYRSMVTFPAGYTPTFSLRALANGSECGRGQTVAAGAELFYANASFYVNPLAFVAVGEVVSGVVGKVTPNQPGIGSLTRVGFYTLVPFTGKTWKTTLEVRATPASGTGSIFSAYMGIQKKILFFIPISIAIHSSSRSQSNAVPWDSYPGGFYSLRSYQAKVPGNPNINSYPIIEANLTIRVASSFNFVPTVSALDITTASLTPAVITSPYTGGSNASYPSVFANYKTQERNGSDPNNTTYNSRHLQFNARSAGWLFDIIQGNDPRVSCTFACPDLGTSTTITGEPQLCVGSKAYLVINTPAGMTPTWSVTGPFALSNTTTSSATVTPAGTQGTGTVRVMLQNSACGVNFITKDLQLGSPPWPEFGDSDMYGEPFHFHVIDFYYYTDWPRSIQAIDYPWKAPGASIQIWISGPPNTYTSSSLPGYISVTFKEPGPFTIYAQTEGLCGTVTAHNSGTVSIYPGGLSTIGASGYSYYPNPVNDVLKITALSASDQTLQASLSPGEEVQIKLMDSMGKIVRNERNVGVSRSLNTQELRPGVYYVIVLRGKEIYSAPIIVMH